MSAVQRCISVSSAFELCPIQPRREPHSPGALGSGTFAVRSYRGKIHDAFPVRHCWSNPGSGGTPRGPKTHLGRRFCARFQFAFVASRDVRSVQSRVRNVAPHAPSPTRLRRHPRCLTASALDLGVNWLAFHPKQRNECLTAVAWAKRVPPLIGPSLHPPYTRRPRPAPPLPIQ
jgi:hypothetical protein